MTDPRILNLRGLLQKALELELFTLPPYLCALYSIPEGENPEAVQILQGVVMEEMLHLALMANILNAVGGEPLVSPRLAKGLEKRTYPSRIPHVDMDLIVALQKFSQTAIMTFMTIEEPERPEEWVEAAKKGRVQTIGHFYDILLDQMIAAVADLGEAAVFSGKPGRQLQMDGYYGGGGSLLPVRCLTDAKDVIVQVAQQGEGRRQSNLTGDVERFGQPKEVAHYYRFKQILNGRYYDRDDDVGEPTGPPLLTDWTAVLPMRDNPEIDDAVSGDSRSLCNIFDETYSKLLDQLHWAFNGQPDVARPSGKVTYDLKNKFQQRRFCEEIRSYEVALSVGDNLADWAEYYGSVYDKDGNATKGTHPTAASRLKSAIQDSQLLGRDFVLLPNATYGGWVRAMEVQNFGASDELAYTAKPVREPLNEPQAEFRYEEGTAKAVAPKLTPANVRIWKGP